MTKKLFRSLISLQYFLCSLTASHNLQTSHIVPSSSVHRIIQARILEWIAVPFSRDLSHPGIEPRSPTLQVDSLLTEPQGKPKNIGLCSLFLLQQIFLTQKLNCLLHCRWILYQLSYQGSPRLYKVAHKCIWQLANF